MADSASPRYTAGNALLLAFRVACVGIALYFAAAAGMI
jgi:hypothetical protein